nr:prickle planar cell polarity protein 3-like [Biomphalaria glabrata]
MHLHIMSFPDSDIPEIIVTCDKDIVVNEVDHNQPCLNCGDHCPGYVAHDWRNICIHCKCLREEHDIFNENFVNIRDRLGWKRDDGPEKSVSKEKTLSEGYTWVPANLSSKKIREYMDQLPNHKVPKVDSDGERYRDIQVIKQLPKQDLSDLYCRFLDGDVEKKEFMIFRELRDQVAMGIGLVKECPQDTTCYNCKGELDEGELSVVASKVGPDALWHPACFTCHKCEELLVDLVYCHHAKHLYCERHYAELIRPRCPGCDEVSSTPSP